MAVIFFDGFNRAINTNHWAATNATFINSQSQANIDASNPVTNNLRLSNIGTHSSKKLYFGVRLINHYIIDDQPFITFYNSSNSVALRLTWNTSTVSSPDIGINVVTAAGSTATTYTVLNSIAGAVWGTNQFVSPPVTYAFNASRVFEFEIDLTNNTIKMQYNGQSLFNSSSNETTSGLAIGNNIAGLAIFGPVISTLSVQDVYLIDDAGSFANTWLGDNFAIHSPNLQHSSAGSGWTVVPADSGVYLTSDDSDTSYVRTASVDAQIAFDLQTFSPSGNNPVVAGIRIDSVSRRLQLDAAYKYLYRNQSTNIGYEMGDRIVLTGSTYMRKPAQFINVNPETSAQWTATEINNNAFGLKAVDPA
jgi:hypothetical protein